MQLGARTGAWIGGETPFEWSDDHAWGISGDLTEQDGISAALTPLHVIGGHKLTWSGFGTNSVFVNNYFRDETKTRGDNYNSLDTRTETMPDWAYWMYMSVKTTNKMTCTVHDDTDDVYLFQNGKIVNGGGIS